MNRYYIAVPNKTEPSYHTIFTWTNYSFTGTYEHAMQTGIELFEEHGLLDNIIEDLIYFYDEGNSGDNDDDSDEEDKIDWNDWDEWDIQEKWENCKEYFIEKFNLDNCDEVVSGVGLWDSVSYDFKKNWDEEESNRLKVFEIE